MKQYWQILGYETKYRSSNAAMAKAERRFPGIIWGNFHQGPNGHMRVVGKLGEADDPVIIEAVYSYGR